jgi:hypothetical protein
MEFIFIDKNVIMTKEGVEMPLYQILVDFINCTDEQLTLSNNEYFNELVTGYIDVTKDLHKQQQFFISKNYSGDEEDTEEGKEIIQRLLNNDFHDPVASLERTKKEMIWLIQSFFIKKTFTKNFGGIDSKIGYRIAFDVSSSEILESYIIEDIEAYCLFTIAKLYNNGASINKCHNCGKYFVPLTRNDEIYCDNVFNNGRTCKQTGYENKIKSDEILKEYRRAYKNKNAYKQRDKNKNPNAEKEFKNWVYAAKLKLGDCKEGLITLVEFRDWLENS